jgi:hypothetical protein
VGTQTRGLVKEAPKVGLLGIAYKTSQQIRLGAIIKEPPNDMAWLKCSSAIYEHHQATASCPGVMTTMHMLAGSFYYFVTVEGVHKGGNRP